MRSWQLNTALMLMTVIIMYGFCGAVFGYVFGILFPQLTWINCGLVTAAIGVLIAIVCYFTPVETVLKGLNAEEITVDYCPEFYEMVNELAATAEIPTPRVYVCKVNFPNAFALGRTPDDALVAITSPLLSTLSKEEVKGVMAHEISHIKNRDTVINGTARGCVKALTASAIMMGMLGLIALTSLQVTAKGGIVALLMFAIVIPLAIVGGIMCLTVPGASAILKYGISRNREYGADETAAHLTGNPLALAAALVRMETSCQSNANKFDDVSVAHLCIVNPFGANREKFLQRLLSTHPSTESRIRRLISIHNEMYPEYQVDMSDLKIQS